MKCNKYALVIVFCISVFFNVKNQENASYWRKYSPQRLQDAGSYMAQKWSKFYNTMSSWIKRPTEKELIEKYNKLWKEIIDIVDEQKKLIHFIEIGPRIRARYAELRKEFNEVIKKMSNVRKEFVKNYKEERLNTIDNQKIKELSGDESFYLFVKTHIDFLQLESKAEVLKASLVSRSLSEIEKNRAYEQLLDVGMRKRDVEAIISDWEAWHKVLWSQYST